jgi:hypothetical protein
MSKTTRNGLKKVLSVTLAVTVTAWLTGFAFVVAPVSAQSLADQIAALQAQIAALTAQLNNLITQTGGTPSGTTGLCTTKNLSQGMRDAEVTTLQQALASNTTIYPEGLVTGYFGPLTRAAVTRFQEMYAAEVLTPLGLSSGTGYYGPSSRAKFNALYCTGTTTPGDGDTTPPVVTGDQIGVSLSPTTPAASVAPRGASNVPFLAINLTAPMTGAVRVDSVILHRGGVGASTDFANVYLYEGGNRLTTGRSVNTSTNNSEFHSLNLTIPAGTTRTLMVSADTASGAAAGNVNYFELVSASSIVGSGPIAGVFPIRGNQVSIAAASAGEITIDTPVDGSNPKVGESDAKIGSFRATIGAAEDVEIRRLAFFQAGSVSRSELTNIQLRYLGQTLATTASLNAKDLAVFEFATPFLIEKGNSRTFEIWADIGGSTKANDTVKFYVDETTDVFAVGRTYGHGVTVTATALDGTTADTEEVDVVVEGGQITITFNGPSAKDIAPDAEDVELYNFTMTAQTNAEIRSLTVRLTSSGDSANWDDVKVVNVTKGIVVSGPTDISTSASSTDIAYTDRWTMNAGDSHAFSVRADLAAVGSAGLNDGETVSVNLGTTGTTGPFGASGIRNLDNNQFITDIVPSGAITGNSHTVRTTSLTLSLAGTPTSQSFVRGTSNVDLVGLNFAASTAQDITITALNITAYGDDTTSGVFVAGQVTTTTSVTNIAQQAWLVDQSTGAQVGTIESVNSTTGIAQFSSLNWTIPAGQTRTLLVRTNLSSNALSNSDSDRIKIDVPAPSTDVTARDPQGNTVSVSSSAPNGTTADSGTRITVADTGSMSVALAPDDSESEAGLVVAGKTNVVLAKYRFTATNEELKITKAQFYISSTSIDEITGFTLWDGATQVGGPITPTLGSASATAAFTGLAFVVPKDGSKTLTVKGNLNTTSAGADSGSDAVVSIDSANFEARGTALGSSTVLTTATGVPLNANTKYVRKTVPTVTFAAGDTLLTTGEKTLMKVTIAADSAEQISVRTFNFVLSVSTATFSTTADNFKVREGGNLLTSTSTNTQTNATITLTSVSQISAGGSKTYEILGTIDNVCSTGSCSVTVRMPQSTTEVGPTAEQVTANDSSTLDFSWSDNSVIGGGVITSADWYNGFEVKTLPSSTYVLSK